MDCEMVIQPGTVATLRKKFSGNSVIEPEHLFMERKRREKILNYENYHPSENEKDAPQPEQECEEFPTEQACDSENELENCGFDLDAGEPGFPTEQDCDSEDEFLGSQRPSISYALPLEINTEVSRQEIRRRRTVRPEMKRSTFNFEAVRCSRSLYPSSRNVPTFDALLPDSPQLFSNDKRSPSIRCSVFSNQSEPYVVTSTLDFLGTEPFFQAELTLVEDDCAPCSKIPSSLENKQEKSLRRESGTTKPLGGGIEKQEKPPMITELGVAVPLGVEIKGEIMQLPPTNDSSMLRENSSRRESGTTKPLGGGIEKQDKPPTITELGVAVPLAVEIKKLVNPTCIIPASMVETKRELMQLRPTNDSSMLRCYIEAVDGAECTWKRTRSGYGFFLDNDSIEDPGVFLLAAWKHKNSHYISLNQSTLWSQSARKFTPGERQEHVIGRLCKKWQKNAYVIYDNGKKTKSNTRASGFLRSELGAIRLSSISQQRKKVQVHIPYLASNSAFTKWEPCFEKQSILETISKGSASGLLELNSSLPSLNTKNNSPYQNLETQVNHNWDGKAITLCSMVGEGGKNVFQFKKCGQDKYLIDFTFPLTPMQAFAIGVALID